MITLLNKVMIFFYFLQNRCENNWKKYYSFEILVKNVRSREILKGQFVLVNHQLITLN